MHRRAAALLSKALRHIHWPQVGALGACARDDRCAHRQPETSASAPLAGACLPGTRDTHATHRHLGKRHPQLSASTRTYQTGKKDFGCALTRARNLRPYRASVQYSTMKIPKSQPRTGQYNAPLGLFAASFSRKSLEATSPRLGTIHETLNSLSCTLSSRATSQQELVSPGALTSHAFTVECGCGLRGAIACTMPMGMAPELLSLSLRTHTLSVRGGARAAFPRNEPDRHASTHPIRAHKARCPDLQGSLATAPHRPALT